MSAPGALHADQVYRVLEDRDEQELRFRSAMITSTALHTAAMLALLVGPLFIPAPVILDFTPVNMVRLQPTPPAQTPAPVEEEESVAPEPTPEPEEVEPPPPEDVPEDLEAQRIKEEEEAARRREEERKRREEDEARRKAAEEDRRRREEEAEERRRQEEEEARRAPQEATRQAAAPQQAEEIVQQAERGEMGMTFGDELSEQDVNYLTFWINRVLTNISGKWDQPARPAGSREIVTIVHFRVDRNGRFIVDPDVRSTSGDRRYDSAAVRAVQAGQPFPPLPQAYRGSTLAINLAFRQ
jgi:TonB family protein